MNTIIEILKKHKAINLNYQDIQDFSQALLFFSQNAKSLQHLQIHLASQKQEVTNISDLIANFPHHFVLEQNCQDYPLLLNTSGSSGIPKTIEKGFLQMCAEAKFLANFIEEALGISSIHHILCSVQQQHLFGLSFAVFMPWFLSTKPHIQKTEPFIEAIMDLSKDVLIASPTLLNNISQLDEVSSNFQNLKLIISAGSPLADTTRKKLKTHAQILDIYGSTETGVIGYNLGNELTRFSAVKLEQNHDQELIVSSPWCSKIQTSDIAQIQGDHIKLLGRSDDIVKINDKRFSLYEIQAEVKKVPIIADCIVYPKDKRLATLVSLNEEGLEHFKMFGKKGVVQTIKDHIRMQDKSYLRFFKITTQIPRNSQGKITKEQKQNAISLKEEIVLQKVEQGETYAIFEGIIPEGCFFFDGHFVDFPLVPGFVELGLAIRYAQTLGISFIDISKISNIKFTAFLRPKDHCKLHVELKDKSLSFKMFANQNVCFSGRALLGETK